MATNAVEKTYCEFGFSSGNRHLILGGLQDGGEILCER